MFELPTSVTIEDKEYKIRNAGDFRMVLDCFSALQDIELEKRERIITSLIIFYDDAFSLDSIFEIFDTESKINTAIEKMFDFFNCGQEALGAHHNYKLIDWEKDTHLIASAVNKVAGIEVRAVEYMHWWTFMSHYISVGESTLSTVVNIRGKIVRGKKLEKYEREFRQENPQYFVWNKNTVEQEEIEALGRQLWNSDKQ